MHTLYILQFNFNEAINQLWEKLAGWLDDIILKLPNMVLAILVLVIFYFLSKTLSRLSKKYLFARIEQESIRDISARFVFAFVFLIGFFLALGVMDLNKVLTSVLAGAGVVGLAIGLALQATLSNTVSGVMLSFIPRIRIGDFVDTNGYSGTISEINLRSIVLRQTDNNYVIIPNSKIVDEPFTNYSLTERSRISVSCGVSYGSALQKVEDVTRKIIEEKFPQQENEGVEFLYTEFGDSSINFMVRFWISYKTPRPKLEAQHAAIKAIKAAYDENGFNIPFPIRTLDFGKNKLQLMKGDSEEQDS